MKLANVNFRCKQCSGHLTPDRVMPIEHSSFDRTGGLMVACLHCATRYVLVYENDQFTFEKLY